MQPLQHRGEQYEHQVRLLQHEHSVLWKTLADTNAVLTRLKAAFDPAGIFNRGRLFDEAGEPVAIDLPAPPPQGRLPAAAPPARTTT